MLAYSRIFINSEFCYLKISSAFTSSKYIRKRKRFYFKSSQMNNTTSNECLIKFSPVFHILGLVLAVLIILANLFVILLFIRYRQLRRVPANIILLSLSINDLLNGVSVGAQYTPYYYYHLHGCNSVHVILTYEFFFTINFVSHLLLITSALHLMLLASERFISLYYALRYKEIVTKLRIAVAVVLTWTSSSVISLIQLIWVVPFLSNPTIENNNRISSCEKIYNLILIILLAFLPSLILFIQYGWLLLLVHKLTKTCYRSSSKKRAKKEVKALAIYGTMFICFVLFCAPYLIVRLITFIDANASRYFTPDLLESSLLLRFFISIINPLMYTINKQDFKDAARHFFAVICATLKRKSTRMLLSHESEYFTDRSFMSFRRQLSRGSRGSQSSRASQ